ncbi:MAG: hypothetical protein KY453_10080 [Gemmatimonadetes bacterium]|nr:hypothetical protein [Gemmatimonadota bacterium]
MRTLRHPLAWLPPLAVGLAAAVAAELSVALLLYTTEGFLEALTVILVVELGALGLGLWSAPTSGGPGWEAMRRRWLLTLVAFTAAAGVAAGWDLAGGLASRPVLRGVGLASLAAFPLYAVGTLLGAMSAIRRDDPAPSPVGAPAILGAAAGAAMVGLLGARTPPITAYLGCVALLSGASLVHGRVLDRRTRTRTLAVRAAGSGRVRVVERIRGVRREKVLMDGGVVRGGCDEAGHPVRVWEEGAARLLAAEGEPVDLLVVGAGAAGVAALLAGPRALTVAEPDRDVADLVAEHLPELPGGPALPCDLLEGVLPEGTWGAAVMDASAWMDRAPVPRLPRRTLEAFASGLKSGGVLLVGGVGLDADDGRGLEALAAAASGAGFPRMEAWIREDGEAGGIVVLHRSGDRAPGGEPSPYASARGELPSAGLATSAPPAETPRGILRLPGWRRLRVEP